MTELALTLISIKLVKNQQAKYAKFLDTNDLKLNIKIYIRYKSITVNKKIGMPAKKEIIILRGIQLTIIIFGYLIITLPTSYKNIMLYYLSIYKTRFVTLSEKKRHKFCFQLISKDIWKQ